ncbi:MAG: hypothetical protein QM775_24390 [Pirellulales bacterium]
MRMHLFNQRELSKSGYRWSGAWFDPPGSHDVMARGLAAAEEAGKRVALLTVVGHGSLVLADGPSVDGVRLASDPPGEAIEIWQGNQVVRIEKRSEGLVPVPRPGCDLTGVDFLIQLSCQVGRARQLGLQDVVSFHFNLSTARCRSVAAALWSVDAEHAVNFVEMLTQDYLRLRSTAGKDGKSLSQSRIRAQALAAVRRAFADELRTKGDASTAASGNLHTYAAFELFGNA